MDNIIQATPSHWAVPLNTIRTFVDVLAILSYNWKMRQVPLYITLT